MIASLIAMAALIGAGDPDGVIVTAPNGQGSPPVAVEAPAPDAPPRQSAAHSLTTDEQIERWIAARREADASLPFEGEPIDDRQVHGEFSVGVGTGGYRSYGGALSVPIGREGRLELRYRDVENERRGLREVFEERYTAIGDSASFQEIMKVVRKVARTKSNVLLRGETGTGFCAPRLAMRAACVSAADDMIGKTRLAPAAVRRTSPIGGRTSMA